MTWSFIVLLLSCKGCGWCAPGLPGSNVNAIDDPTGEGETVDTGDSGVADTGPPPACPTPEEEPNNSFGQAQDIPMEAWAIAQCIVSVPMENI